MFDTAGEAWASVTEVLRDAQSRHGDCDAFSLHCSYQLWVTMMPRHHAPWCCTTPFPGSLSREDSWNIGTTALWITEVQLHTTTYPKI